VTVKLVVSQNSIKANLVIVLRLPLKHAPHIVIKMRIIAAIVGISQDVVGAKIYKNVEMSFIQIVIFLDAPSVESIENVLLVLELLDANGAPSLQNAKMQQLKLVAPTTLAMNFAQLLSLAILAPPNSDVLGVRKAIWE